MNQTQLRPQALLRFFSLLIRRCSISLLTVEGVNSRQLPCADYIAINYSNCQYFFTVAGLIAVTFFFIYNAV